MNTNDAHVPNIPSLSAAINPEAFKEVQRALKDSLCGIQMSDISAKASKVLENAETFKTLTDTVSKSVSFDIPEAPRLAALDNIVPNYTIPDLTPYRESYRTNWQQLIIIGNGFDLQCGLRSKFSDFFKSRFDVIAHISNCGHETWRKLVDESNLTLWDFILEANIDSLWCDIEGTIEQWVLSTGISDSKAPSPFNQAINFFKSCSLIGNEPILTREHVECELADENRMYSNMARYTWTLHPEIAVVIMTMHYS